MVFIEGFLLIFYPSFTSVLLRKAKLHPKLRTKFLGSSYINQPSGEMQQIDQKVPSD